MHAEFQFAVDVPRSLVRITLGGFFTPADIVRFAEARAKAHQQLRCGPNAHVTLVDIRGIKIQSQESVAGFAGVLASRVHRSRRIAFVVETSLARMQLKRAAGERSEGIFLTIQDAERWLFAAEADQAA
ncbi:MAG TPA: hypothetical protein VF695_13020 [Sphingomonas sp.]|jgi:hypothetical protein